jgi:phosphoglycolate phosphatase-like HAD superfamily hydrolase
MAQGFKVGLEDGAFEKLRKELEELVNGLNAYSENHKVKVQVELDSKILDAFKEKAKEAKKQVDNIFNGTKSGTKFTNDFIPTQSFEELELRLKEIRSTVDKLASVRFMTDADENIKKAVITYKNFNKEVQETMKWRKQEDETWKFETTDKGFSDNIAKLEKQKSSITNFMNSMDTRFVGLQKKYADIFNNPEYKQSVKESVEYLKGKIDATKLDPKMFDKNDFNKQWKDIAESVRQVALNSKEQEQIEKNILNLQKEIEQYKKQNLTTDKFTKARNNEHITSLTTELDLLKQKLTDTEAIKRVTANQVELNKDFNAKESSVDYKDEVAVKNQILSIQKQINSLQVQNINAEESVRNNNKTKIANLESEANTLKEQLNTKTLISEIDNNKKSLNNDVKAQEIAIKQKQSYDEVEKVLNRINQLEIKIAREENKRDGNAEQLKIHLGIEQRARENLLTTQIQLNDGTKVQALNAEQIVEKEKLILELNQKLLDVKSTLKSQKDSSTTNNGSPDVFGEQRDSNLTFDSDRSDMESFTKTIFSSVDRFDAFNNSIQKSGQLVKQLDFIAKGADGTMHKYRLTIDKATNSTRLQDLGTRKLSDSANGLVANFGKAVAKLGEWILASGAVYAVFNKLKEGFNFVNDLNKSLTEIGIVTYQNQTEVASLATEYNNLAKEMRVTTGEIAKASVEFYRQGLSQSEVMERMRTTTQYAKVSNLDFAESAEILTATVNSMGVSIERASDTYAYLGDATSTGSDEVGRAMQKVAGSANSLSVPLEKVSSWIALLSSKTREGAESIGKMCA